MITALCKAAPGAPLAFLVRLALLLEDNPPAEVRLSFADSLREMGSQAVDEQTARDLRALADIIAAPVTVYAPSCESGG